MTSLINYRAGIYQFKVNKRSTESRCEICSNIVLEIIERCQWRCSNVFHVKSEQVSHIFPVLLLLSLLLTHISHLSLVLLLWTLNMHCSEKDSQDNHDVVRIWKVGQDFHEIFLLFKPFHVTGLFLYPLKTSENLRFCNVFRGYRKILVAWND